MHRRKLLTHLGVALSVLLASTGSHAISMRHDVPEQDYLDLAAGFDAVGALLFGDRFGTATLVGPDKVLTAAHNVDDDADGNPDFPLPHHLFRLGRDLGSDFDTPDYTLGISAIDIHPLWVDTAGLPQYDLAVLTLSTPFYDIDPMVVSNLGPFGKVGTMVGYGLHGTAAPPFEFDEDGIRRAAQNIIDYMDDDPLGPEGFTIQPDFDTPDTFDLGPYGLSDTDFNGGDPDPLPLEGSTASGDSGGPLTVDFGDGEQIVGVLNGGFQGYDFEGLGESEYGDVSIYATIYDPDNQAFLINAGVTVIPEPASALLVLLGVMCITPFRFRGLK